jgi:hypothetical protein
LTADALVAACARSPLSAVGGFTRVSAEQAHVVCAAALRGPVYDPRLAAVAEPVRKPVVVFRDTSCAAAGYADADAAFLAALNDRRAVEIRMRAVPSACPTLDEALSWVTGLGAQAGTAMTARQLELPPGTGRSCWTHMYVDWDTHTVEVG